jgi:hypothetical protein
MEATTQYFGKCFFINRLEFHCPSKFLCQTSGRQNNWSLVCTSQIYGWEICQCLDDVVELVKNYVWSGDVVIDHLDISQL